MVLAWAGIVAVTVDLTKKKRRKKKTGLFFGRRSTKLLTVRSSEPIQGAETSTDISNNDQNFDVAKRFLTFFAYIAF